MSRAAVNIELNAEETDELNRWLKSGKTEQRKVERAKIVLRSAEVDNLNTHKPKNDRWLKSHPNVHLHFTPTRTSWLNQIECWFSILSRQALQGASFVDVKQLREAIDDFTSAYNTQAAPFEWRQGEIKQQPMRDNIAYFCR